MNNKKIGSDFERDVCTLFSAFGYWVHFIAPDARGAQPFDIIAVKGGEAIAIDCKTSVSPRLNVSRLEDNQNMAFRHWMKCGNREPALAVLYNDCLYFIAYNKISNSGIVDLREEDVFISDFSELIKRIKK